MVRNFTISRHALVVPQYDLEDPHQTLICRCFTLSDTHLAYGFVDDTVISAHITTFFLNHSHLLGSFSQSVSGIEIVNSNLATIASVRLDGDVYVTIINGSNIIPGPIAARRAISGAVVNNKVLIKFTGCSRLWVGLFVGHTGGAFQIWNALIEQHVFIGGSLTDPETVQGGHMLTEFVELVCRVRVTKREFDVACMSSRLVCYSLRNSEVLLHDVGSIICFVVGSLDVCHEVLVVV